MYDQQNVTCSHTSCAINNEKSIYSILLPIAYNEFPTFLHECCEVKAGAFVQWTTLIEAFDVYMCNRHLVYVEALQTNSAVRISIFVQMMREHHANVHCHAPPPPTAATTSRTHTARMTPFWTTPTSTLTTWRTWQRCSPPRSATAGPRWRWVSIEDDRWNKNWDGVIGENNQYWVRRVSILKNNIFTFQEEGVLDGINMVMLGNFVNAFSDV